MKIEIIEKKVEDLKLGDIFFNFEDTRLFLIVAVDFTLFNNLYEIKAIPFFGKVEESTFYSQKRLVDCDYTIKELKRNNTTRKVVQFIVK